MAAFPPPEGLTEEDYDSIHAAVVETVRGRWFLAEYARRSRVDEVQEMLTAIGRLEKVVTSNQALPPPGDASPHLRLLAQRVSDLTARLAGITEDLRESGADPYLCDDLDTQIRAIAALPTGQQQDTVAPPPAHAALSSQGHSAPQALLAPEAASPQFRETAPEIVQERLRYETVQPMPPRAEMPEAVRVAPLLPRASLLQVTDASEDPRLAALATLDRLPLKEKLALFS